MASEQRSPWVWVGLGCGTLVVLGVACAIVGGLWTVRSVKQFERDMKDPQTRTNRALGILGADELPPGYYASVAFSIPMFAEVAILTDHEAREDEIDPAVCPYCGRSASPS